MGINLNKIIVIQVNDVNMSDVKKGKIVDPDKASSLMLRSWRRTQLSYDEMTKVLKTGQAYFIGGIKRQTAHSAAQSLTRRLGFKVIAMSAKFEEEKGYAFFKESLEEWVKKGVKEGWL